MSEWISVKEKLPEEDTLVIVEGGVARWCNPRPEWPDGMWITETGAAHGRAIQWVVTHWMPLPDPPEAQP